MSAATTSPRAEQDPAPGPAAADAARSGAGSGSGSATGSGSGSVPGAGKGVGPGHASVAAATRSRLGVEEEFHLVDPVTGALRGGAAAVLAALPAGSRYKPELMTSAVEINSGVWDTLDELRADLLAARAELVTAAAGVGLGLVAAGAAPLLDEVSGIDAAAAAGASGAGPAAGTPGPPTASLGPGAAMSGSGATMSGSGAATSGPAFPPVVVTAGKRFDAMRADYGLLADEQLICGLQVHVDCPDRDLAVQVISRIQPWLPVLLALSASSPYWRGSDTGYASYRTPLWRRWPTTGPAPTVGSAEEYDRLIGALTDTGVAHDPGMVYFDSRLSEAYPTIEIRIADSVPRVDDVVLIAGLARALVARCVRDIETGPAWKPVHTELLEAARWRAARSGLSATLVDPLTFRPAEARAVVESLLTYVAEAAEEYGDLPALRARAAAVLADGGSAARQRAAAGRGGAAGVVRLLMAETRSEAG